MFSFTLFVYNWDLGLPYGTSIKTSIIRSIYRILGHTGVPVTRTYVSPYGLNCDFVWNPRVAGKFPTPTSVYCLSMSISTWTNIRMWLWPVLNERGTTINTIFLGLVKTMSRSYKNSQILYVLLCFKGHVGSPENGTLTKRSGGINS